MSSEITIHEIAALCTILAFVCHQIKILWKILRRPALLFIDDVLSSAICFLLDVQNCISRSI